MKKSIILILSFILTLSSCGNSSNSAEPKNETEKTNNNSIAEPDSTKSDSTLIGQAQSGLSKYINHLHSENFFIDTNRLKEVAAWRAAANSPKEIDNGVPIVLLDFPVMRFRNHFTNPKTYFFAKWNTIDSTFKNGNDYLLMTWEIDSIGIEKEIAIYKSLIQFMGNFPCFCFRDGKRIYALGHRLTSAANYTLSETKKIRDYIAPASPIYGYYNARKIEE